MPRKKSKDRPVDDLIFNLADRIKAIRNWTRLSQQEFAALVGVSQGYVSDIELKKAQPNLSMMLNVVEAFPEVRPAWLLTGLGPMLGSLVAMEPISISPKATEIALEIWTSFLGRVRVKPTAEQSAKAICMLQNMCERSALDFMKHGDDEAEAYKGARNFCYVLTQELLKGSAFDDGRRT